MSEQAEKPKVDPEDRAAFEARVARDLAEAAAVKEAAAMVGFDVTSLPPAEYEERGITLRPLSRRADVSVTARIWLTHSEVDTRYPIGAKIQRALAREAVSFWWARKRTLKGLRLHRTFPCLGKFRVQNEVSETGPVIVVCDVCGECFGVRRDEYQAAIEATLV